MKNNVINFKEFKDTIKYKKKKKKKIYFIDFIDWKNYTIPVEAESEQEARDIVEFKCLIEGMLKDEPTNHLFEIVKVQCDEVE